MSLNFSSVACVGMRFRQPEDQAVAGALLPGDPVHLEREPYNPHDENAIKVIYSDHHIGYIARDSASFIAAYMDEGRRFGATVIGRARSAIHLNVISDDAAPD